MARKSDSGTPNANAPVTIRDVATAAGVSTATVSHVFSGRRPVSPSAAERVLEVARGLGYQANSAARGLATGRSFVLALHVPFDAGDIVVNPFFASILATISTTASAEGYGFILLPAEQRLAARQTDSLIRARRIDGALLLDPVPAGDFLETLEAAGLPIVSIGRIEGRPDAAWVDGDVRAQMFDALEHLAERGYRRPALLTVAGRHSFLSDSESHYRAWCEQAGRPALVLEADALTEEEAFRRVTGLESEAFDSLLCANDILASGALRAVHAGPEPVGGRAGVLGIGDSFYARRAVPALTSLATHAAEKGKLATQLLLSLIEGREPPDRHIVVAHELVVRDSTPFRTAKPRSARKS